MSDPHEVIAGLSEEPARTLANVRRDGSALIASVPERILRELDAVAERRRLRVLGVVPFATVLACGAASPATIAEGNTVWTVRGRGRSVAELTCIRRAPQLECVSDIDLAHVARAAKSGEVVFKRQRAHRLARRQLSAAAAMLGVTTLLIAPPIASLARSAELRRELNQSARAAKAALEQDRQAVDQARGYARIRIFERDTRLQARLPLLARLTKALPEDIFISQLAADSTEVELTVVGVDVARIPQEFQRGGEVANVRVVGAITHDMVNERPLQRATIRLDTRTLPASGRPVASSP